MVTHFVDEVFQTWGQEVISGDVDGVVYEEHNDDLYLREDTLTIPRTMRELFAMQ